MITKLFLPQPCSRSVAFGATQWYLVQAPLALSCIYHQDNKKVSLPSGIRVNVHVMHCGRKIAHPRIYIQRIWWQPKCNNSSKDDKCVSIVELHSDPSFHDALAFNEPLFFASSFLSQRTATQGCEKLLNSI